MKIPEQLARLWTHRSLRTKLIVAILLTTGTVMAILAVFAFGRSEEITAILGQQLTTTVRRQAEQQLTSLALQQAAADDEFLKTVRADVAATAEYMHSLFAQEAVLAQGEYWDARAKLIRLSNGQWDNPNHDIGSVFARPAIQLDDATIAELNTSMYLDFTAPGILQANPNVVALYYVNVDGVTIYYPNVDLAAIIPNYEYDPSTQAYFQEVMPDKNPAKRPYWSAPYQDNALTGLVVTHSAPVYDAEGMFRGVIGVDVQLARLTEQVSSLKVGQDGYAFLIDRAGRLIAMPEAGYRDLGLTREDVPVGEIPQQTVLGQGAPDLQDITSRMLAGESGVATFVSEGIERYLVYEPLPEAGYSLGIVVPVAEMQAPIAAADERIADVVLSTRSFGAVLVAAAFITVLWASLSVSRLLTAPLKHLTQTAQEITAGDLSVIAQVSTGDEIGSLARAFNAMTARLRELIGALEQRVEESTEQLRASADVGRAAASILDPDDLLRETVNLITDRFGFYYAALFTLDEQGKYAVLREATGDAGRTLKQQGHQLEVGGQSMVGYVTAQRKSRIALDVGRDAVRFANPLLPETRSEIALPLLVGDRVLGALDVQSTQEAAFDEASAASLQSMADQVAIALNNSALFTELQRNVSTLNGLLEMSRDISGSRTLQDLTERVKKHLESILGTDSYYLALVDERQTEIRFVLQRRSDDRMQDEAVVRPFRSGPGLAEHVIRTRHPLRFSALEAPIRLAQLGVESPALQPRAYVGIPIIAGERVLGVLGLQDFRPQAAFSADHEKLATALANQLAATLENLRLTEEVQQALGDLDAANRILTGQAWERYAHAEQALSGEWRSGAWVPADRRVPHDADLDTPGRLTIPLRVRGEAIGEFNLLSTGDQGEWTPEDKAFAQALVDQVGQTLETVRLLEETERLAGRERLINEITVRVRQTVNVDSILQTAVNELGRSLNAARVFARIGGSEAPAGGDAEPAGNGRGDDHA